MTTTTNINSITDLTDQLTLALILAITAPTEEKGVMCDKMAENLAQSLTFEQIEACKAAALEEIESGGLGSEIAARLSSYLTLH